jgi:hypothetical protein
MQKSCSLRGNFFVFLFVVKELLASSCVENKFFYAVEFKNCIFADIIARYFLAR